MSISNEQQIQLAQAVENFDGKLKSLDENFSTAHLKGNDFSFARETTEKKTARAAVYASRQFILDALMKDVVLYKQRWAEVRRTLPMLTRLRAEERARREELEQEEQARRQELEREVVQLRTRCRELEERLDMGAGALVD